MTEGMTGSGLMERARAVIPGGMYGHMANTSLPENYPQFLTRAEGARVWDHDHRPLVDLMSAFGANLLGYRHPGVEAAAAAQAALGDTMSAPGTVMVDLCERLVGMIAGSAWAMPCKNGTDATSMALVVARKATGRRKILIGRGTYHGAANWCTPVPAGTLPEDRAHLVYYRDQDARSLAQAMAEHAGDVAGVLATSFRHESFRDQTLPSADFARAARELCDAEGAVLILDEVRAGFRLARGSSWEGLGVTPDLACYGKVLGNGHAISALLGAESLRDAASSIYVTGSYWFSAVPMAAAMATLSEITDGDYLERMVANGHRIRDTLALQAARYGLPLVQTGPVQMPQILFDEDHDLRLGYGFCRTVMQHGAWMHPSHNMFVSPALTEADLETLFAATDAALAVIAADRTALPPVAAAISDKRLRLRAQDL